MIKHELETEYKSMITKEMFNKLLDYFDKIAISKNPYTQINYYFDTEDFTLINQATTVRIRYKKGNYELQVKIPKELEQDYVQQQEWQQELSVEQAKELIENGVDMNHPLLQPITEKITAQRSILRMVGSLETKRHDFEFYTDMISLDESKYFEIVDYELEWETTNYKFVPYVFNQLGMTTFNKRGKIIRFLEALKKQRMG